MSRINRVPKGLQDLLGSTNQGDNPSDLLEGVRAGFDIFPFWAGERLKRISGGTTNLSIASTVNLTVPDGKIWIPVKMSSLVTNTGAATLEVGMTHWFINLQSDAGGTNSTVIGASDILVFNTVLGSLGFVQDFDTIFYLPSGTIIRFHSAYVNNAGVNTDFVGNLLYYEFTA